MPGCTWVAKATPSDLPFASFAGQLEISPLLVMLLAQRGHTSLEAMRLYLNPGLKHLAPLSEWPGLLEAAALLVEKLCEGAKFCVWGDYDVDGITSTALVIDFLTAHGFACTHYIPNRLTEGYGLNCEAISRLAEEGVTLLLTVDSGISDLEAIAHAKALGMTVIISDHHLPAETLPPADAIVNPRLASCPCPSLAGVGVAFFLMAATGKALEGRGYPRRDVRTLLDLVALGTLADVVDVGGQNRILIKNGLLTISEGLRPGIAALKSICNFSPAAGMGAGQVVFSLAPRINAAGRLGSSEAALSLLLCKDILEAATLAENLSNLNRKRREEEDPIFAAAMEQAGQQVKNNVLGIVLYGENWHPGVIGIVASRIVEKYHRPAVVLTATQGFLKGSGRSYGAFNLHDAFTQCADILRGYGGHRMAAGLSLYHEQLEEFRARFNALAGESFGRAEPEGVCLIDAFLPFELAADFTLLKELEMLQPFGSGNAEPVFASPPVRIMRITNRPGFCMLDLLDPSSGITLRAKAWRDLASFPAAMKGQFIRVAFSPRIDRYNGVATVELRLKDWIRADVPVASLPSVPL